MGVGVRHAALHHLLHHLPAAGARPHRRAGAREPPGQLPCLHTHADFDWSQFSNGKWFVTQKFATRSTCLTYEFTTDELGFKEIVQLRQLPYSEKVGLGHEYRYVGKLYAANDQIPAKMSVRFPLSPVGASSFVVLDTDYTSYGLVCTCQDIDLFFTTAHRLSYSILQKDPVENTAITDKLKAMVEEQAPNSSHDFDPIKQDNCEYDREKAWTIDPTFITGGGASSAVREVIDTLTEEFDFKSEKQVREEASQQVRRR